MPCIFIRFFLVSACCAVDEAYFFPFRLTLFLHGFRLTRLFLYFFLFSFSFTLLICFDAHSFADFSPFLHMVFVFAFAFWRFVLGEMYNVSREEIMNEEKTWLRTILLLWLLLSTTPDRLVINLRKSKREKVYHHTTLRTPQQCSYISFISNKMPIISLFQNIFHSSQCFLDESNSFQKS